MNCPNNTPSGYNCVTTIENDNSVNILVNNGISDLAVSCKSEVIDQTSICDNCISINDNVGNQIGQYTFKDGTTLQVNCSANPDQMLSVLSSNSPTNAPSNPPSNAPRSNVVPIVLVSLLVASLFIGLVILVALHLSKQIKQINQISFSVILISFIFSIALLAVLI